MPQPPSPTSRASARPARAAVSLAAALLAGSLATTSLATGIAGQFFDLNLGAPITIVGDGIGGFATPEPFPVGAGPKSITWGDFNDDGVPDLVTANGTDSTASVLPSNP